MDVKINRVKKRMKNQSANVSPAVPTHKTAANFCTSHQYANLLLKCIRSILSVSHSCNQRVDRLMIREEIKNNLSDERGTMNQLKCAYVRVSECVA